MTAYKINRPPFHLLTSVLCMFIAATCTKIERVPKVTTGAVSEITHHSARALRYSESKVFRNWLNSYFGASVRCIRYYNVS